MIHNIDGMDLPPFFDPVRPPRRRNFAKAISHFRNLVRNSEDTSEAFLVYESLPSRHFLPRAKAFTESPLGRRLYFEEPSLPELLDDHAALRRLPQGSVGQAYANFTESESLSAAGLVAESAKAGRREFADLVDWYGRRERDTHDLIHIIAGYGRDPLGEQCVLLFTHGQSPSLAHLLLGYGGMFALRRRGATGGPMWRALGEARRNGRRVPRIAEMPIRDLLRTDLAILRKAMGVEDPTFYHRCHEIWRESGFDPRSVIASSRH